MVGVLLGGFAAAAAAAWGAGPERGSTAAQGLTVGAEALPPDRRAALQAEVRACVDAALASRAQAIDAAWLPLAAQLHGDGPVSRAAMRGSVRRFVATHSGQKVRCANEAAWRVAPVTADGLTTAQDWLAQAGPPLGLADAGARWVGDDGYPLRYVPPGTYAVGCTPSQLPDCGGDEQPVRTVTLSRGIFVGEVEVTQSLYLRVMGRNPAAHPSCGDTCPVEQVTWFDAIALANAMSTAAGLDPCYRQQGANPVWPEGAECLGYRLPTEAEWEVAARGGADHRYAGGDLHEALAWTLPNSGGQPHPVGQRNPNGYGLYDMSGNVLEWVWDVYSSAPPAAAPATDPSGPPGTATSRRVFRGGSWRLEPDAARVANRNEGPAGGASKHLGVRLVRTAG